MVPRRSSGPMDVLVSSVVMNGDGTLRRSVRGLRRRSVCLRRRRDLHLRNPIRVRELYTLVTVLELFGDVIQNSFFF